MSTNFDNFKGKIILNALVTAQEGQAEKVLKYLTDIRAYATSDAEPGCLTYRVTRSDNNFFIFEEYENQDAIKTHFETAGFKALGAEVKKGALLVGGPNITYYQEV